MSALEKLVHLTNARLSFPHITAPQAKKPTDPPDRPPMYGADLIIDPNSPDWGKAMQAMMVMAQEKWKEHAQNVVNHCNNDRKLRCYGGGHEKVNGKTYQVLDGYEGKYYITANNKRQPQIIDAQGQPIDPANTMAVQAAAGKLYGGSRVNAAIKFWGQENQHGRGIRCELVAIQFLADDTPFGEGVVDASGLFGATPGGSAAPGGAPPFPGFNPAGPAAPGAPAAPAWGQPQVAMPAAPFPGQQAAPLTPPPNFGAPPAPGLPPFLH